MVWPGLIYKAAKWAQIFAGLRTLYTDNENSAANLNCVPTPGVKLFLPNKLKWNLYNDIRYEFRNTQNLATHDWHGYSRVRSQLGMEVFVLVVHGKLNKQIAVELGTGEQNIKVHRGHVMHKMHVRSVADLVRLAERL